MTILIDISKLNFINFILNDWKENHKDFIKDFKYDARKFTLSNDDLMIIFISPSLYSKIKGINIDKTIYYGRKDNPETLFNKVMDLIK